MPMKHLLLLFALVILNLATINAQNTPKKDLSVFPNPTTEYITVHDQNDAVSRVAVFSLVGRKLKEFDFVKGEHYSIGDLPKGMYLVQMLDRERQLLSTQKIEKR